MPVPSVRETTRVFIKTTIILFTNTTLNQFGFVGTATGHSHFQNNEMDDMLVYTQPNYSFLFARKVVHISPVKT